MEQRDCRSNEKQDDVKRQDIEIAELVGEQNKADMRLHCIIEDSRSVMPIKQIRRVEEKCGGREKRDGKLGDEDLGDIDMKSAGFEAEDQPLLWHCARRAIDENAQ